MFRRGLLKFWRKYRKFSTKQGNPRQLKENFQYDLKTNAWQIHSYGDINELQYGNVRIPRIESAKELIIQVNAASVNPIDLLMMGGYGQNLLQIPRGYEMELPLILGRDFCGTVLHKGVDVGDDYRIGDEVYGFVPLHKSGSFSEIIVAQADYINKKPPHLNAVESASLPYASQTAWSALFVTGNTMCRNLKNQRILILGASGGVGTVAVQLMKSQGCCVFATCSTDAVPLVQSLGADRVFDYKDCNYLNEIAKESSYDIILDCAKFGSENIPKNWKYTTFIMLNSPLLKNTDKYGIVGGLITSFNDLLQTNLKNLSYRNGTVRWGYFLPLSYGFRFLHNLINEGKIQPIIHKEFTFCNLPDAFDEVAKGHLRGKVVVDYCK